MFDHNSLELSYSSIFTPDHEPVFSYSYKELQHLLNGFCKDMILKKVYADLWGYVDSFGHKDNFYDFSYMGGPVLLLFDKIVLELRVEGEGMVQYRTMRPWEIRIRKTFGLVPLESGTLRQNYYYDLGQQFLLTYEDQKILGVTVESTHTYSFLMRNFDEIKAQTACKGNRLPNNIYFHLGNGIDFCMIPDQLEYFYIELREQNI